MRISNSMMQRIRGKHERFRCAFGPLSGRFRAAFGVAFLSAPHYEKRPLFSCFLRFEPKMHRSGKNGKLASYLYFSRTAICAVSRVRYCVTACHHVNS